MFDSEYIISNSIYSRDLQIDALEHRQIIFQRGISMIVKNPFVRTQIGIYKPLCGHCIEMINHVRFGIHNFKFHL